ncbi:AraC-like DNA-binding protein [Bosea sp. BE125]|uniref:helix-turn-helix domain-containing protein n=1 Tax=Bosea sp. BE125 TaxID=2817909 RepID=UPI00285A0F51|nr:AraC family transcriptional regulator [Bosea sp. BE125]MDR6872161.1 AraC-like DNA-binding protein [Bosea sp. BE125]
MTFQPSMTSTHEGVTVLEPLRWRRWNGVVVDLWHAACEFQARGHYVSAHPRLFIVLEAEGGSFETRLKPHGDDLRGFGGRGSINFVPAHLPLWGRVEAPMRLRHLDLHFDPEALCEQICERLSARQMAKPRLMFDDPHLFALAGLIAREVAEPDARHDLYGDSLILALLIDLFGVERREPSRGSTLSAWQLRRVTDYITEHCNGSIRLQDLAKLVGLSQSYFSHAFKASTGVPPHQWQIQERVRKGQEMLLAGQRSLTEIAIEAGFSDQAHFTRAFRRVTGETPAVWRRAMRGSAAAG